jgi:TRAP-type uncharacterized transport system fused permease subunit
MILGITNHDTLSKRKYSQIHGLTPIRHTIAGFLIPYVFIYAPSMILIGKEATLAWCLGFGWTVISAGTGLWMIASAIVGFAIRPLSIPQRVFLVIGGLLLVKPGLITDATGIGILIGILVWQKFQGSRESTKGNLEERFGNKEEKRE